MMKNIELSFAMTRYDRIQPLVTGEIKPDGLTLAYVDMPVPDIFLSPAQVQPV
jgi:hypothetical protein